VELAGRVVLVTGASRGIGAATCAALTRRGAVVVAAGRDETALAEVAASSTVVADAADPAAAPALVAAAVDRHGRLDAVVANAGLGWAGEFAAMDPARITELVDVNLRAPMLLARAALPVLRRPGALVLVTSIAGLVGSQLDPLYSLTKGGVTLFTKSTALEFGRKGYGIRVNSIHPGLIQTDMGEKTFVMRAQQVGTNDTEQARKNTLALHPIGRLGEADDIAKGIVFLASDDASFMTGAGLVVDGGWTAH